MKNAIKKRLFLSFILASGLFFVLSFPLAIFALCFPASSPSSPSTHPAFHPSFSLPAQTNCGDIEVAPTPSSGLNGDDIDVSINISGNQCQISSFGFDLFYDTSMFSYQGISKQNCLTSDWSTVDADEISPGQVRIGGFAGSGSSIEPSNNGCLVVVKLRVIGQYPDFLDGQQSTITIDAYTDELAAYSPRPAQGLFTFECCLGDISLPANKSGTWGDIVNFAVTIANNDEQVCDFAFDFSFDPSVFEFKDTMRSAAIQNWSTLNHSQVSQGKVHIEGSMGAGTCIPPQSSGNLAVIKMMVRCAGYDVDTSTPIRIDGYQGGISSLCPNTLEADFLYRACPRLGDMNADGNLTPGDAQKAFEVYLGRLVPTLNQLTVSDANCSCPCDSKEHTAQNSCTTPADAQWIFEHYLKRRVLPLCCANYQCPAASVKIQRKLNLPFYDSREVYALPTVAYSGEKVMVPVMVNDPKGIHYFNIEMFYPQDLLEYKGLLLSPLTRDFQSLSGREEVPGVIRIEGQGDKPLTTADAGSLCVVVFQAREETSGSAPIVLNSLSGDFDISELESLVCVRPQPIRDGENSLSLGRGTERGGMLTVPVEVADAFGLKAFGLEVKYSPDKMTFIGVRKTDLTQNFAAVDGNEIERGVIRVGGYSVSGIQDPAGGVLAELIFQVNGSGGEVEIIEAYDDLKEFEFYFHPKYHPQR